MNNESLEYGDEPKPTLLRSLGLTVVTVAGCYVGLKIGEELEGEHLPFIVEFGTATAIGLLISGVRAKQHQ